MTNITQEQGSEASNTNSGIEFSVSADFQTYDDKVEVLPGMDVTAVTNELTPADEILADINETVETAPTKMEILAKDLAPDSNILEIGLQDSRQLNWESIRSTNPVIERHIKGLEKTFKQGDETFWAAFDGRYLRVMYKIPGGDEMDMVFDTNSSFNSKRTGLEIVSIVESQPNEKSLNMKSLIPEDKKLYYHKQHWLQLALMPASKKALGGASSNGMELNDGFFHLSQEAITAGYSPIEIFAHEGNHLKGFVEKPKTLKELNSAQRYGAFRVLMNFGNVLSMAAAIGVSPWMLLPQAMLHIYTYYKSRDLNSQLGKDNHGEYAFELDARLASAILADYLRRKGFVAGEYRSVNSISERFVRARQMGYQPFSWTIMDKMRKKDKKTAPEGAPIPSPSLVGLAT
jgi:hypothetical protein